MKFIFDFDDVIFETTPKFKERLAGVQNNKELYDKLMSESPNFVNQEILKLIRKAGKENCYMVTYGDKEFQKEKIEKSGVSKLFSEIFIVQNGKKEAVESICAKHSEEQVLFIDDKAEHFEDLDF